MVTEASGQATCSPSDEFVEHVRGALNRLYDPTYMRRSPLAVLFGVSNRIDTASSLQRILIDAIQALRPRSSGPSHSLSWCIYSLLCSRYIQQLNQQVVANQLGISERTMRRRQDMAIRALADRLWRQLELIGRLPPCGLGALSQSLESGARMAGDALAWIKDTQIGGPAQLAQALAEAVELVRPLADRHSVPLTVGIADELPGLAAHPVALKQVILNLLHVGIHQAAGAEVALSARPLPRGAEIEVRCANGPSRRTVSDEDARLLEVTRQLAELCRGSLTLLEGQESFAARVVLPAFEQHVVLAVDDQGDTLQLLERYVSNTAYRVVGTRDPAQAVSLAEKYRPRAVVVDIMMPDVDGWSLLAALRRNPITRHIPIVVCTVLPLSELALSLGADAFIQKPLSRQGFLDVIDRQVGRDREPETKEPGSA
ncbi:MAG: response regulator [Anaerolineae bacterium]|nr:response regulator [Anaerolineae bacterium]